MESHVLVLIKPELVSNYTCQLLKCEISKMKSSKGDRFHCIHCRKSWPQSRLIPFRNHLIKDCLPKQGLGVTLSQMIDLVTLKYPVL